MSIRVNTRTFTPDELDAMDISAGGSAVVHTEHHVEEKRWGVGHDAIFRTEDDGKLWQVRWYEPATEMQECDTWGYYDRPDTVKAVEVEPYEVTVTKYRPIAEAVTV